MTPMRPSSETILYDDFHCLPKNAHNSFTYLLVSRPASSTDLQIRLRHLLPGSSKARFT